MSTPASLSLSRFKELYPRYALPITLLSFLPVTLMFNAHFATAPDTMTPPISLPEASIILGILMSVSLPCSYLVQRRMLHKFLAHHPFTFPRVLLFALVFYSGNLVVSIALAVLGFPCFVFTLFVYLVYPIIFLVFPSHLLIGLLLGIHLWRQGT